jgi:hypothetical protein
VVVTLGAGIYSLLTEDMDENSKLDVFISKGDFQSALNLIDKLLKEPGQETNLVLLSRKVRCIPLCESHKLGRDTIHDKKDKRSTFSSQYNATPLP